MDPMETWERLDSLWPSESLFAEKEWRRSLRPFPLSPKRVKELKRLGEVLDRFLRSADHIYRRSHRGSLPGWIADYLDRGKSASLISIGKDLAGERPAVIRPDLILQEQGVGLVEIDAVPGGIGLTAWLGEAYSELGFDVLGGRRGMLEGMAGAFGPERDVVISQESGDYRPEMSWLCDQLGEGWALHSAESYRPQKRPVYRFFELFDLPQIPFAQEEVESPQGLEIQAPLRAFLEEKSWLALFWNPALREVWQRELRAAHDQWLRKIIPYSWIMDPRPLPPHGSVPRLDLANFQGLTRLSQKERQLVLKVSGFSDIGWGSRSVTVGHDVSQPDWNDAVGTALESFDSQPYLLQEMIPSRVVEHSYWREDQQREVAMKGRVRLCPYYFREDGEVHLRGVLATICPEDKKILHGMSDAILVPCMEDVEGY